MLKGVFVDLHKPAGGRQGALGHHIRSGHRWGDVQQCVGDHLLARLLALLAHLEHGLLAGGAHLGEHVAVAGINALAGHHLPQRCGVGGHPEDAGGGGGVDHRTLGGHGRVALDGVVGQVGDLLGGAGALDRHRRAGEHRIAPLEVLDALPGVGGELLGVVAADAPLAQRLGQPLDGLPAELHAGGHHQGVVGEGLAAGGGHRVVGGIKAGGPLADPADAGGDQGGFVAAGLLQGEQATAHQGPTRLVVVIAGGLEDRHLQAGAETLQPCRHGDAGGTTAHDQKLVMAHGRLLRCLIPDLTRRQAPGHGHPSQVGVTPT